MRGKVFRREGEYWTIAYEGLVFRVRDTKGLRYLALLLRDPGRRHPARDLLAAVTTSRGAGDTPPRAQTAADEHARIVVTKHLRAAIRRIQAHHAALGFHLDTTIKTGQQCAYLPDPTRPTRWAVGDEGQAP